MEKEELYNYEFQIEKNFKIIKDIKDFLKQILNSKLFDDVFKLLYGNDFENIFKDEEFTNYYFRDFLKFVPYKSSNSSGFTDKYTLKTYIFLKKRIIVEGIDNLKLKLLIREALKIGALLEISLHEINHFIYAFLFISDNTKFVRFRTPNKRKIVKLSEGSLYFELFLFGKIINKMALKEVLYLLNKNNYNKNLKEFRDGFSKLDKKDLLITGNFKKFNIFNNNNTIESNIINSSIVVKESIKNLLNESYIYSSNNNCTLTNREIDLSELKKFVVNNHHY